jgi:uncharacterized protein YuzE
MATMMIDETTRKALDEIFEISKHITSLPLEKLWLDYDREADVLYLSLQRPQKATDSLMLDDIGVLLSYHGKELVGITILEASKR